VCVCVLWSSSVPCCSTAVIPLLLFYHSLSKCPHKQHQYHSTCPLVLTVNSIERYPLNILWTVLRDIHWIFCGQYWAISIEYSVDSIERYPLNILWTVLSDIRWIFCGQYCLLSIICLQYCAVSIDSAYYCAISIDSVKYCVYLLYNVVNIAQCPQ
jgi:hypothetical protein